MALRTLSLCSGIGGLDLGLKRALGDGVRTVCYVEREAYAAAILVARMAESALDAAPVWDDLYTFDAQAWRGAVDLVVAGFPCQPWSVAGARRGTEDDRWLWPRIEEVIREVGPRYAFLENVPGLISGGGLGAVLGGLANLGFDAEWTTIRASDVGAPHRRERVFILAVSRRDLRAGARSEVLAGALASEAGGAEPRMGGGERAEVADATGKREGEVPAVGMGLGRRETNVDRKGGRLADTISPRLPEREGIGADHATKSSPVERSGLPAWPPGPEDPTWRRLDPGAPQPGLRGVADGPAFRVDRLRALGNAVVPEQAALAFRELWRRAHGG